MAGYFAALRASERQRQLALQQSEFVAAVSHELRAPLAAVRLLAEELIDLAHEFAPRREEYHRLILREARRLGLLIDNALKHAPPHSAVTVSLSHPLSPTVPGFVALEVQDQGPGIPAADHARIFEAFVRRGSELRRETPGVGLGLAIVHRLVQAHHGRIRVDSQPGRGARFTVELPLETKHA